MTILPSDQLQELVRTYPELTQERRELLVEFLEALTPAEHQEMLACGETPAEEMSFINACFGITDDVPRLLPDLKPTEKHS